jgi:hypothetical protein
MQGTQKLASIQGPETSKPDYTISAAKNFGDVIHRKVALAAGCKGAESLRDFGGLYLVHGKYLLEPAVMLNAKYASMVDVTPRAEFIDAIAKAKAAVPELDVEFTQADFREPATYNGLRPVDVSILYEVLLHQENYMEVLRNVTKTTNKYICIAQPCLKEEEFPLPGAAVLLQMWDEALKNEFRTGGFWPAEPKTETFDTRYWMWGQTASHLIHALSGFGWDVEYIEIAPEVCGKHWDFSMLRFKRR